jgi:Zn-dependent protease
MLIIILSIIILVFSAILHEYAHGFVARRLGDDTAEREGRLTLNPLKHLDPFGSVMLPLLLVVMKSPFFIAWAKPVPYNPYNLRDQKFGELKVALSGPLTNFILVLIFALFIRFIPLADGVKNSLALGFLSGGDVLALTSGSILASLVLIAIIACFINLILGLFNLIPIPPLDGSKILLVFLSNKGKQILYSLERYGFIILIFLLAFNGLSFIFRTSLWLFAWLTGL